jgi:hypothetical protein
MASPLKHCRKGHARTLSPVATFFQFKQEKELAMGSLSIIYRKISDLKPYPRNARTHKRKQVRQIKASIEEFGFAEVPTVQISHLSAAQKKLTSWLTIGWQN